MRNFLDSVVTLTLVFLMLVVAPINIATLAREVRTERMVLREISQFMDRVGDKKEIAQVDLDSLYMGVNSHGGQYEVKVTREVRAVYYNPAEDALQEVYYSSQNMDILEEDESVVLNVGDVVKLDISAVHMGRGQQMLWSISRIDKGKLDLEINQMIR